MDICMSAKATSSTKDRQRACGFLLPHHVCPITSIQLGILASAQNKKNLGTTTSQCARHFFSGVSVAGDTVGCGPAMAGSSPALLTGGEDGII